jgi:fatty acid synthase subunit alpha, fungi type
MLSKHTSLPSWTQLTSWSSNVDVELKKFEYLVYPSKSIHTDGIRCGLMTSFGFGQVGGSALILHPRFLFGAVPPYLYEQYKLSNATRALASYKSMSEMMVNNSLVKIKDHPPFTPELEGAVLLNPLARVNLDKNGEWSFPQKLASSVPLDSANEKVVADLIAKVSGSTAGIGVDQGMCTGWI